MNAAPDHRQAEAKRLAAIRGQLDALGAAEWQLAADGEGMMVETSMPVAGGVDRVLLCRFGAHATSDEMQFVSEAKFNIAFLLSLVDRAVKALRQVQANNAARLAHEINPRAAAAGWMQGDDQGGDGQPPDYSGAHAQGQPQSGGAAREPNFAAEAAIKCAEPAFRVFLEERHGLERPLTDDKVAARLRSLLGVTSRRDLNSDERAAARWKDIRREFDVWRKGRG